MKILFGIVGILYTSIALHAATIDVQITDRTQDAEERVSNGSMDDNDGTLDIVYEGGNQQIIGLRFLNITLPTDAHIRNAYLQFRASGSDATAAAFIVSAESSTDASAITRTSYNLSNRTETTATYAWDGVSAWNNGSFYQSGDLSTVVQEVKDLSGWASGNAMLFMIKAGTGCNSSDCRRRAQSRDATTTNQPLLHIEYGTPPMMGDVPNQEGAVGRAFTLNISDYVTTTDGDPILSYTLTGTLPSGLTFNTADGSISGTPTAIETQSLTVYATDQDGNSNSDTFSISIVPPSPPVLGDIPDDTIALGSSYTLNVADYVTTTNGDPILSYTLTGTLPTGLSFNSTTGVISGTPTVEENQTLSVYATDIDGNSNTDTFTLSVIDTNGLQVEFRMDECYWLGGANGVDDDVKDSSGFHLDAQSRNRADNSASNFKICRAGDFNNTYSDQSLSDAVYYPNETTSELAIGENQPFSVSAWLYRHNDGSDKWMAAAIKVSDDGWTDGWGLEHASGSGTNIDFFVGNYTVYARATLAIDTWTHVVGTYDGSTIRIYTNGVLRATQAQNSYSPGALAVAIGDDISGSAIDDRWQGNIDEVKIWNRALSATEITTIYNNENAGLNYDGTTRTCYSCSSTTIDGHTWEFIGIPADERGTGGMTVNDVFGDDMAGTFNTDWRVYKRIYSATSNASGYQQLGLTDTLEFGQGFWLGSSKTERWDIDGLGTVDYNSSYNGTAGCVSSTGRCVEINLTPVSKDFAVDTDDGSGWYRYNMTGFVNVQNPVDWANCRLLFDDNGTFYTPSDANTSGLANKQIWLYDPSDGSANSNGYITCSDTSPGGCKLVPFNGFWVQLQHKTKNHTVKLIVPEK